MELPILELGKIETGAGWAGGRFSSSDLEVLSSKSDIQWVYVLLMTLVPRNVYFQQSLFTSEI